MGLSETHGAGWELEIGPVGLRRDEGPHSRLPCLPKAPAPRATDCFCHCAHKLGSNSPSKPLNLPLAIHHLPPIPHSSPDITLAALNKVSATVQARLFGLCSHWGAALVPPAFFHPTTRQATRFATLPPHLQPLPKLPTSNQTAAGKMSTVNTGGHGSAGPANTKDMGVVALPPNPGGGL